MVLDLFSKADWYGEVRLPLSPMPIDFVEWQQWRKIPECGAWNCLKCNQRLELLLLFFLETKIMQELDKSYQRDGIQHENKMNPPSTHPLTS